MNARSNFYFTLLLVVVAVSGCELAGDILEFGFWTGVVIVVVVVAIIWAIARAMKGRRRP